MDTTTPQGAAMAQILAAERPPDTPFNRRGSCFDLDDPLGR